MKHRIAKRQKELKELKRQIKAARFAPCPADPNSLVCVLQSPQSFRVLRSLATAGSDSHMSVAVLPAP